MTFLTIKNKALPDSNLHAAEVGRGIEVPNLSNAQIADIVASTSYYYSANNLILKLVPTEEETELTSTFWVNSEGFCPIKSWVLWKVSNSETTFERENYVVFDNPLGSIFTVSSISADRSTLELDFSERTLAEVEAMYRVRGVPKPEFGLVAIAVPFDTGRTRDSTTNRYKIYLLKYTHNSIFSSPSVVSPTPPEVSLNKFTSLPRTYENLYIPNLTGTFVYNFFDVREADYEINKQRNYRGKAIADIPKYIRLSWKAAPPTVRIAGPVAATPEVVAESPTGTGGSSGGGMFLGGVYIGTSILPSSVIGAIMTGEGTETSRDATLMFDTSESERFLREGPSVDLGSEIDSELSDPTGLADSSIRLDEHFREPTEDAIAAAAAESGYIGYVILKERINEEDGTVEPVDLIVLPSRNITTWLDWKIAYGETYRYKIRSVFKFINNTGNPIYADSDALFDRSGSAEVFDSGIFFAKAYYFDSEYSNTVTVQAIDFVRPNPPQNVRVFPHSRKKHVFLTWNQKQQNKDLLGFNVYRKEKKKNARFVRINGNILDLRHNYFIDNSIEVEKEYIYAIESVDIHANRSFLSTQYVVSLRHQDIELEERCENPVTLWARQGLSLNDPRPQKEKETIQFQNKFDIVINPLFQNLDENTTYLLKITSLDTFKEKEIKLIFKTKVINHRARNIRTDADFDYISEEERRRITTPVIPGPGFEI